MALLAGSDRGQPLGALPLEGPLSVESSVSD